MTTAAEHTSRGGSAQLPSLELAAVRELAEHRQWVCWRYERRGSGKPTKVPISATGAPASSTDSRTWANFAEVCAAFVAGVGDGVGFVVTADDSYTGADFDGCVENGKLTAWAADYVGRLGSYTEVSPSGTGVRVFVRGKLPPRGRKRGPVELYDAGRFLTVTGCHLEGTPERIEARQEALEALHAEAFGANRNGARCEYEPDLGGELPKRVTDLAEADTRIHALVYQRAGELDYPSESEADLALANLLARARCEPAEIDAALRWRRAGDGKDDQYFRRTVERVLEGRHEQGTTSEEGNIFSKKGAPIPRRVAEAIQSTHGAFALGVDGRLYRYSGGVYRGDGEQYARARTRDLLGDAFTKHAAEQAVAYLRATDPSITEEQPRDVVNVTNGLLDWRTGELGPHREKPCSTIQLPVAWNPQASCPRVADFFRDVLPDDAALGFVYELMGYLLCYGNPYRLAVLLLGPGGNGKSVLLRLAKALLGDANVAAVPLQVLTENRFAASDLFGKLANIAGDLDARAVRQSDIFKMVTGGDPIRGERKHREPFTFTAHAVPVFSANEAPLSSDQTEGWFDRWLIVPMERRIEKPDPSLSEKLTEPAELEGLLVRAVAGLRDLMERGRFDLPPSVKAAGASYRRRLDSVRGFVEEECQLHPECWEARRALYTRYQTWARESGRLPLSAVTFYEHLRNGFPDAIADSARSGRRGFRGIGVVL